MRRAPSPLEGPSTRIKGTSEQLGKDARRKRNIAILAKVLDARASVLVPSSQASVTRDFSRVAQIRRAPKSRKTLFFQNETIVMDSKLVYLKKGIFTTKKNRFSKKK